MNRILISTSQAYGRSQSSALKNTALTPDILNAGAIAIYGIINNDTTTVGNSGKTVLVGDAGSGTTGVTPASVFATGGSDVQFYQGAANYPVTSALVSIRNVLSVNKQTYISPLREVTFVGSNGTSGSFNLPTIVQNATADIVPILNAATTTDQITEREDWTALYNASASAYTVALNMINSCNNANNKTHTAYITNNGTSLAANTGTATAYLFTKGSSTVLAMIQDPTAGWVASTGTVAAGLVSVPHENMISVTFTANILGTAAGRHIVAIGGTIYNVADAGTAAQNAAAVIAAINAGSQATATLSNTSDVTIVVNRAVYATKILVTYTADDSAWTTATLTVNTTTGETVNTIYNVATAVTAGASFVLDRPFVGETAYVLTGTSLVLTTGTLTAGSEYGIKLICDTAGLFYQYALQGILIYATLNLTVNPTGGLGSGPQVVKTELGNLPYRGQIDTYSKIAVQLPLYADSNANYDIYVITCDNSTLGEGVPRSRTGWFVFAIALAKAADGTANAGAAVLEAIMTSLFTKATFNF